jgi:tRNA A37 threonylcarbamoyladenosine dehydratase
MAAWARSHEALFIASGAAGGKRLAHKLEVADLAQVTHDPLLAQVRYRLRKHHAAPRTPNKAFGIACVFSREPVMPPDASCELDGQTDGSLNCHGYGSTVAVTASFGLCAAGWMLDSLAKHSKKV